MGTFDFESAYHFAGDYENLGDSYAKARAPFTAWKTAKGGSTSSGMCFYTWDYNYWSTKLNQRVRIAARFRGNANNANCSRRYMNANNSASNANRNNAGSAQVYIQHQTNPIGRAQEWQINKRQAHVRFFSMRCAVVIQAITSAQKLVKSMG